MRITVYPSQSVGTRTLLEQSFPSQLPRPFESSVQSKSGKTISSFISTKSFFFTTYVHTYSSHFRTNLFTFVIYILRTYSGFQAAVDTPEGKIFQNDIFRTIFSERKFSVNSSILELILPYGIIIIIIRLAEGCRSLHDPNLRKCNNHLVSFIKVEGLFVSYIDDIFDIIKSRT